MWQAKTTFLATGFFPRNQQKNIMIGSILKCKEF